MPTRAIVIRGGRVVDPVSGRDEVADIRIEDGVVTSVGHVDAPGDAEVIDAEGLLVSPGWIDVHVHLRQPGFDAKESIATGTAAAVAGGFVAVACMPNTKPALDSPEVLRTLLEDVDRTGVARVYPIATITRGRTGDEAVDFDAVIDAGAIGWSDDGDTTANSAIMREVLVASRRLNRPVIVHCEDKAIATGAMHEGEVSRKLGIEGIPAAAEEIIIARDLMLAELTGGWLHVCHVSTGRGIELIHEAKQRGVNVTAEVMPHHLVMSDEWVAGSRELHNTDEAAGAQAQPCDPNTKVNPPLRSQDNTRKLLKALQDGWFDCFGTDHAPHADPEKSVEYQQAAFGLSGLEFAFPLSYALVRAGHLGVADLVRRWTVEPAKILGVDPMSIREGSVANITVFDPEESWTVTPEALKTKSKNTPLLSMTLRGRAVLTIVDGEVQHRA
ncbi:MAG TPA: dihydroorotase [Thermomicrobiales bacterium]|nr:dihydroorotase [Thermomicrobiales bacterium]